MSENELLQLYVILVPCAVVLGILLSYITVFFTRSDK